MDVAASTLDAGVSNKLNMPRSLFFNDDQVGGRLDALAPFVQSGLKPGQYLPALKRSVVTWLMI